MRPLLARLSRLVLLAILPAQLVAQDRLKTMPGYEQYQRMAGQMQGAMKSGALTPVWAPDGKSFEYQLDGKWYRFDVATRKAAEETTPSPAAAQSSGGRGGRGGGPARGRQFDSAFSPDSVHRAIYRNRNLYLSDTKGENEVAITTDGSDKTRVKNGTASWVYGEELDQPTAMWWSPDGKKLAYYRFDESGVPDFYLTLDGTKLQTTVDVEAYPKAGVPNPIVDLMVYDLTTRQSVKMDVRDGKRFENDVVGHYVYNVQWSPNGTEILFNRTNRRQNILEFTACAPATGHCRVVVHDEWPASWLDNNPTRRFLTDGNRFIWESPRNGWANYYLYDLSGKLLAMLTRGEYEVAGIVRVDETPGAAALYYMARDGDNHMKVQLHRVGLDGKGDTRLTDPAFTHTVNVSPDGKYFVDVAQTHDQPPVSRLVDASGRMIAELARSDLTKFAQLGLRKVEMFTYLAADGKTTLHGMISFPSTFDPSRKYPLLASVYGGPAAGASRETFAIPNATSEYVFLVLTLDSRAVPGMGKRSLDAIYLKLGQVEMDDMAEGVKALWNRPYVDKDRVGIYGSSYGGYSAVMELLRHPDVFAAAAASSSPTDWRNYDTIYTERYMWIPQENKEGYDKGSAMTYAANLRGRLLLYYGSADNNVHPSNSLQLIQALQRAGKSFELQVGPDIGHSAVNGQRMMEFFIENLVLRSAGAGAVP